VSELKARLRSKDAEERRRAVLEVESLDLLVGALADDSWRVRKQAVDRLAKWSDPRGAAAALVGVLAETDQVGLRNSAIETLTLIGEPAVTALARSLGPQQVHRKFLIDALGSIGDARAVPGLMRALQDPDPNVRVAAAEALGRVGGQDAVAVLIGAADSDEMLVQLSALDALAALGAVIPVDRLLRWAEMPVVRVNALKLLGLSREAAAVPALLAALSHKTRRAREAAVQSLALVIGRATGAELAGLRDQLARLDEIAVQYLARAVSARAPEVRRAAAQLLGLGSHASAVSELAAGLADPETGGACSEAIAAMGPAAQVQAEQQEPPPPGGRVEMSPAEFNALRDLFHEHCGLYFQDDAAYLLRRRLAPRLNATGTSSFEDYLRVLRYADDREAQLAAAVDNITTNETYFFREAYQLRAFRDEILPKLFESRPRGRRLDVWCAGCSTGEEAYTIGMLILDAGGFEDWDVRVVGTDISRRVLKIARGGRYRGGSLRSDDLAELRRFVEPVSDVEHSVADAVRELVHFREVNLNDGSQIAGLGEFDVVFCRNVLMYFDRQVRERVVHGFYEQLAQGGFLLLGHPEPLISLTNAFELHQLHNDTVYRKP